MRKTLLDYQSEAVDKLFEAIVYELNKNVSSHADFVFQSPTGSGKTIMLAEFIKKLTERSNLRLSFIWISVHDLHNQSRKKLENYYKEIANIKCNSFFELRDNKIEDNEILFLNWESINEKNNKIIQENENGFYLENIINNTRLSGSKIILIIDESHQHSKTLISGRIIDEDIKPDIKIDVSATPKTISTDIRSIRVDIEEVRNSEMIKKSILVNPDIRLDTKLDASSEELVLELAIQKRAELRQAHILEKTREGASPESAVNPLIVIQLPNKTKITGDMKENTMKYLSKNEITTKNKKLVVWLSDEKSILDMDEIVHNNNEAEVIIVKESIAVGWDCPRASILVLFREWGSTRFGIQTLGRIIRSPELKHYSEDKLNHAYVYTNLNKLEMKIEETAKEYGVLKYHSRRKEGYTSLGLPSVFIKNTYRKPILHASFVNDFNNIVKNYNFETTNIKIGQKMVHGDIYDIDREDGANLDRSTMEINNEIDIEHKFDKLLEEQLDKYRYESIEILKRALYISFQKKHQLNEYQTQLLVLNNEDMIKEVIQKSLQQHTISKSRGTNINELEWEVPKELSFSDDKEHNYKKYIMNPCYLKIQEGDIKLLSKPEKKFIEYLESHDNVKWWFKNGVNSEKYFAIQYDNPVHERPSAFYIDFVVYTKNNKIGLFDTKEGITAEIARPKAEMLTQYIKKHTQTQPDVNLFGGIVVENNSVWYYSENIPYKYTPDQVVEDWSVLKLD